MHSAVCSQDSTVVVVERRVEAESNSFNLPCVREKVTVSTQVTSTPADIQHELQELKQRHKAGRGVLHSFP